MKFLIALIFSLSFASATTANETYSGYPRARVCTRNEYREEYFPGTQASPGYVRSWTESVEVPCGRSSSSAEVDTNDCKEGSIIGGLLGAGLTMSSTRGKDRWWAVPAGGAAGAMIGCRIDGG